MTVFSHPEFDNHEHLSFVCDPETGLKAIVAVHNTSRGPALGGCRMFPYASDDEEALRDVLHLVIERAQHQIEISINGKGRWIDNVFVRRLWRSVKHEKVYLYACCDVATARRSLGRYFTFYNTERKHQALDDRTPDDVHYSYPVKLAA